MTADYDTSQRAEGRIRVATDRLADKYPFHCKILERFKIVERPEVETMAVAASKDDVLLYHNPDFVMSLPTDQLGGVLLHELHHVLFGHIFADPQDFPDEWARTISEEVTVNEFVTEPLPTGLITLDVFPELPPMESTKKRYEKLKKSKDRIEIGCPSDILEITIGSSGQSSKQPDGDQSGRGRSQKTIGVLDNHDVWQEFASKKEQAQDLVEGIVEDAAFEVEADQIPEHLRGLVGSREIGDTPGDTQDDLAGDRAGNLDWRRLLRRYVGQLFTIRPVFNRPPRRFPDLVGVVPGKRRQCDRPRILSIIDTSGSLTQDLLEQISAELGKLARHCEVTVVECDCEIHSVYTYRPIESVAGRGGTDFRPPLKKQFLQEHRPDLVVYFTDGFGEAPKKPPRVPLIWCLTPDGEQPADWGRVIQMHMETAKGPESP